jgi:hypothetical protein
MKLVLLGIVFLLGATSVASARSGTRGLSGIGSNPSSHHVSPYTTSKGTSVQGHYKTNSNTTQRDNFGTRGNVNPYNGSIGNRGAKY